MACHSKHNMVSHDSLKDQNHGLEYQEYLDLHQHSPTFCIVSSLGLCSWDSIWKVSLHAVCPPVASANGQHLPWECRQSSSKTDGCGPQCLSVRCPFLCPAVQSSACFTGFQLWAIFSFESQSRWLASHYAPSAVAAWPGRSSRMSLLTPIRSLSTACCASKTSYSRNGHKHPCPQQRSNIYLQPKN